MKHKIFPPFNLIFLLLMLMGFTYQSCVSPRDRSIRDWEKYERKTIEVNENKDKDIEELIYSIE